MEKKIAGLLGAVATLGAFNAAQAAPMPTSGAERHLEGEFVRRTARADPECRSAAEGGR